MDTVLVADYDRDGHLDIATPGGAYVRRGRGDGKLENRQPVMGDYAFTQAGAVADFNGDRWPDLAFSGACDEIEIDCDEYPTRSIAIVLNWTGRSVPPCVVPGLIGASETPGGARARGRWLPRRARPPPFSRRGRKGTVIRQRPKSASVDEAHPRDQAPPVPGVGIGRA